MPSPKFHNTFRQLHRWLGFFLAGIMAVYAVSGILMIFRSTDFMQFQYTEERQLAQHLDVAALDTTLKLKNFKMLSETPQKIIFNFGDYDKSTGLATVSKKDYPAPLGKLVKLHKATTNSPLFILNISFGLALLFFVISAFLLIMPRAMSFKNGIKIAGVGFVFALLVVIFSS
ncbi:MAG: hypothetical protein ACJA13_002852 [Paraglaciecola sp.]|jgi:hypothetical protein